MFSTKLLKALVMVENSKLKSTSENLLATIKLTKPYTSLEALGRKQSLSKQQKSEENPFTTKTVRQYKTMKTVRQI